MGLFDFFEDSASGLLSTGLQALGLGGTQDMGGLSSSGLDFGVPVSYPIYQPTYPISDSMGLPTSAGSVPMVARAVAAGLPRWSAAFPRLWQFITTRFPRINPSRALSTLQSLSRKWGPTAMIGLLGIETYNELLMYSTTHKRRRMNPANTKALRRSMRRLKGFERLAHRVSGQLARTGGRRRSRAARCGVCRATPCRC